MMKLSRLLSIAILLILSVTAYAQSAIELRGVVKDSQGPVIGAIVLQVGHETTATETNLLGEFTLKVPKGSQIKVTCIGYRDVILTVGEEKNLTIELEEDSQYLDEVVVLGYSTQKKEFLIGSVSQATDKELLKAPTTSASAMLTGRLSGLTNIQTSGTPGEEDSQMYVRGFSTFNNSSPLVIVDGVERPMSYLNPNDIASVSVLKDAATAAIYGVRGANGVVLVTTKSGAKGSAKISYDGSTTFTQNTAVPELLNAEQYVYWHNKARELDGLSPLWTEENLQKLKDMGLYGETDYLSEIYKKFGFAHQHNISASGGTDKVRYFTSIGLLSQDGILKQTDYQRYNLRSNVEANIMDGLTFSLNVAGSYSNKDKPGYSFSTGYDDQGSTAPAEFSPITQAFYAIPILKPYSDDGQSTGWHYGTYTRCPVASLLESGYQNQKHYSLESSTKLEYAFQDDIFKGLKLSVFAAYNFDFTADQALLTPFTVVALNPTMTTTISQSGGIDERNYTKSSSYSWNMTVRPQIDYSRTFGDHQVSFLGLFERYQYFGDTMSAYAKELYADSPVDISLGMNTTATAPSGSHYYSGFASFAGQLNYAYKERYLLAATVRHDGTYKFAPQYRWGTFPSIAAGWVISKEPFFQPALSAVDFLKLRVSYGELGSDDTDAYLYKQLFYAGSDAYTVGGTSQSAFYSSGYVYENLTWSRTQSYNAGFEARFFKNKLTVEFDWFYKYTSQILEQDSTGTYAPSLGGNNPVWMNTGRMDNRGFELTVRHDNWLSNGLNYSISGILAWNHNRVLSRRISDDHPSYRKILGEPVGSVYGFHSTGLFQTQEQIDNYPSAPTGWLELGALMYEDVNGDGRIDSDQDYVKIARSSTPELTFSMNFDISYKGFALSALFQGAGICDYLLSGAYNNVTDNTIFTRTFYGDGNTLLYLVEDSWTPDNTSAKYPRLSTKVNGNNGWATDLYVVDGSYLRLKNAQFSYDMPDRWFANSKIHGIRLYIAGTNIFTLSHFKYLDPENPGVNNGYYPQQKTYSLGLNLSF